MSDGPRLNAVVELVADCEHKTAPRAVPGTEFAYSVGTRDIKQGRIELAFAKRVDEKTYGVWTKRGRPRHQDLILAREAPVGQVGYVPENAPICLGQRTVLIRADRTRIEPRYLHYLLLSPPVQNWMQDRAAGSTVPHLNVADVRQIPLGVLPGLSTQRAIVEVLVALDEKLECNKRLVSASEQLAIALASRETTYVPLTVLAGAERLHANPNQFGSIDVDHFSLPAFDATRLPDRCSGTTIKSNKFRVSTPAVLVSKLNPRIPRVWHAVPDAEIVALASTEFVVLRPIGGLTSQVLWTACASKEFVAALQDKVTGTTGSHQRVRPEDVMATPVADVRNVSAGSLLEIDALVDRAYVARRESVHLTRLRDALLPRLLSGELRVREAGELVREAV